MVSIFNGGSSGCIGAKRKFRIRRSRNGIQMNLIRLSRLRCLMKQGQCGKRVRQFRYRSSFRYRTQLCPYQDRGRCDGYRSGKGV